MATVKYHTVEQDLHRCDVKHIPRLILICGDPYLVRRSLDIVNTFLIQTFGKQTMIEFIDGMVTPLGDIIEQALTFSLLPSKKIMVVKQIPLFQTDTTAAVRYGSSESDRLSQFFKDGWPNEHILVFTTGQGDKRKKIFKSFSKHGMVIDCNVSTGARKADQDEQWAVMQHVAKETLDKNAKQMGSSALRTLYELTGFNPDQFARHLEKLSVYAGERNRITDTDVTTLIVREKKDPIFNLTNALMEKDGKASVFYLNSLVKSGFHALQILKSLENLFRKLINVSEFLSKTFPEPVHIRRMTFNQFKQSILPRAVQADEKNIQQLNDRETFLTGTSPKKKDLPTDFLLAPNPKNAYPVFQVFQKSENFDLAELCSVLIFLSDLDYHLKTSHMDAVTQIEHFIIKLCNKGGFVYAQENQDRCYHL